MLMYVAGLGLLTQGYNSIIKPEILRINRNPWGRFGFDAGDKTQGACRDGSQSR